MIFFSEILTMFLLLSKAKNLLISKNSSEQTKDKI